MSSNSNQKTYYIFYHEIRLLAEIVRIIARFNGRGVKTSKKQPQKTGQAGTRRKSHNQKSNALIILSDKAEEEAKRLGGRKRGIQFDKPLPLADIQQDTFNGFCSIDGALIVDFGLNFHGIGYILDGLACVEGETSRGSRYNSTICYLKNVTERYGTDAKHFALVLSEDTPMICLAHKKQPPCEYGACKCVNSKALTV